MPDHDVDHRTGATPSACRSRFDLGVGMVVAPGTEAVWPAVADLVDVVEVEPQTFWEHDEVDVWQLHEPSYRWLEQLDRPIICHGVGYPVGGSVRPDPLGVSLTAASAVRLGARHWSEHLSFNRARRGEEELEACFLLPPFQTWEAVDAAVIAVGDYRSCLDLPFLIETPVNYLRPVTGELNDGHFVAEVAVRADCGILLDLHNVWANERNGRQSVEDFVDQLPLERVLEVHLAGGFWLGDHYLDAHDGSVDRELLAIAARLLPRLPCVRAVVFEAMPDAVGRLGAAGVRSVLEDLHRLVDGSPVRRHRPPSRPPTAVAGGTRGRRRGIASRRGSQGQSELAAREHELVAWTTRAGGSGRQAGSGAALLRHLTDQARLSLIVEERPAEVQELCRTYGAVVAEAVGAAYLKRFPARLMTGDAGADFAGWWRAEAARLALDPL